MLYFIHKLPFLVELIISGGLILLYALFNFQQFPQEFQGELDRELLEIGVKMVPLVVFFITIIHYINCNRIDEFIRRHVFSLIVLTALILTWGDEDFCFWLCSAHLLSSLFHLYDVDE